MANFRVGQRVRKIAEHPTGSKTVPIGTEGVIIPHTGRLSFGATGLGPPCEYCAVFVGFGTHVFQCDGDQLAPILGSDNRVVEFEVGVSPWVPEHLRAGSSEPTETPTV